MTPKEALDTIFKLHAKMLSFVPRSFTITKDEGNAIDSLNDLVAKAEPMKPLDNDIDIVDDDINIGVCKCGKQVDSTMRYCDHCGQALDWSDEK